MAKKKPDVEPQGWVDENEADAGTGGEFIVENGVRRRVSKPTQDHPEGNRPRDKDGKPIIDSAVALREGDPQ